MGAMCLSSTSEQCQVQAACSCVPAVVRTAMQSLQRRVCSSGLMAVCRHLVVDAHKPRCHMTASLPGSYIPTQGLVDVEDLCSKDASSAAFPAWLKRHATQTATAGAAEGAAGAGTAGGAAGLAALEGGRQGQLWLRPSGMDQVWEALAAHPGARLVAGNTGAGVYKVGWDFGFRFMCCMCQQLM